VLGLKTGDTLSAGQVLLSYAALQHDDYLAVVMGTNGHMRDTQAILAYAVTALGPYDHFYSVGNGLAALADWPEWLLARLDAAGPLDTGRRTDTPAWLSPAERALAAGLRDLLPGLLGGEKGS
jgi:hypothetical protein